MNRIFSSAFASLSFLATGTLLTITPASAATIVGTLEISGANIQAVGLGIDVPSRDTPGAPLVPATTVDFGFIGDRNPANPDLVAGFGEFAIDSADGVFEGFNPPPFQAGRVRDLPAESVFEPVDNFLGFSTLVTGPGRPATNPGTFTAFFDLANISGVTYTATANGINVNFDVEGVFTLDGKTYDGEGIIGGEVLFSSQPSNFFANPANRNLDSFFDYIGVAGNIVNIDSWSGTLNAVAAPVPEPASVLGVLAVAGLAGGTLRKRQQK